MALPHSRHGPSLQPRRQKRYTPLPCLRPRSDQEDRSGTRLQRSGRGRSCQGRREGKGQHAPRLYTCPRGMLRMELPGYCRCPTFPRGRRRRTSCRSHGCRGARSVPAHRLHNPCESRCPCRTNLRSQERVTERAAFSGVLPYQLGSCPLSPTARTTRVILLPAPPSSPLTDQPGTGARRSRPRPYSACTCLHHTADRMLSADCPCPWCRRRKAHTRSSSCCRGPLFRART